MTEDDDIPDQPSDATAQRKPLPPLAPGLHLVATPIGNARDITLRALDALREADILACEDTRVTSGLLARHGIERPLTIYNDHNAARMRPKLLEAMRAGKSVALVSDAGMPLIADPGWRLVQETLAQDSAVTCLPGASAALVALALSGLPSDRFFFAGFLPSKPGDRRRAVTSLAGVPATLLIYEAPHRLVETLADCAELLGPRPAAVARELTKKFEEVRRGTLAELSEIYLGQGAPRGEIVLVIGPPDAAVAPASESDIDEALRAALETAGVRDAAAEIAARYGLARRDVYARALAIKRER